MALTTITKDAEAVLDYSVDWSAWLAGDTIAASTWVVTGPSSSFALTDDDFTDTTTTFWLEGGTLGHNHKITNHITTAGVGALKARQEDRSINVSIVEK